MSDCSHFLTAVRETFTSLATALMEPNLSTSKLASLLLVTLLTYSHSPSYLSDRWNSPVPVGSKEVFKGKIFVQRLKVEHPGSMELPSSISKNEKEKIAMHPVRSESPGPRDF